MIILMGAVIFFSVQDLWRSPAPLSETRYLFAAGLAVIVIVLKLKALRKAATGGEKKV
jgi:hypothetical protein